MYPLVLIKMRLTGAREAAVEAKAASTAIAGTGTAAAAAGKKSGVAAVATARFGSALRTMGKWAMWAAGGGLVALGYGMVRSVNAYREARKVGQQTNAVIKSTGGIANITAKEVGKLAGGLSLKTGVDDEEIQSAVNQLLTFTKLRNEVGKGNDVLSQASATVLDLAAGTKTDLVSASKQLGKALNDPVKGLTALSRGGTQFTEVQSEMIQKLWESGNRLGAQKLILKELDRQYAGSARANQDVFDRFAVAWENLEEKAGKRLFPTLRKGVRWMTQFVKGISSGKGPGGAFADVIKTIGDYAAFMVGNYKTAVTWTKNFIGQLTGGKGEVGAFGRDIKEIGLAVKDVAVTVFPLFLSYVKRLWSGFKSTFGGIARVIGGVVKLVGGILRGDWGRAWEGAKDIVGGSIRAIIGLVETVTAPFRTVFSAVGGLILDKLGDAFDFVKGIVKGVLGTIRDAIAKTQELLGLLPGGGMEDQVAGAIGAHAASVGGAIGGNRATAGGRNPHRSTRMANPRKHLADPANQSRPSEGGSRRERLQPIQLILDGKKVAETTLRIADTEAVIA